MDGCKLRTDIRVMCICVHLANKLWWKLTILYQVGSNDSLLSTVLRKMNIDSCYESPRTKFLSNNSFNCKLRLLNFFLIFSQHNFSNIYPFSHLFHYHFPHISTQVFSNTVVGLKNNRVKCQFANCPIIIILNFTAQLIIKSDIKQHNFWMQKGLKSCHKNYTETTFINFSLLYWVYSTSSLLHNFLPGTSG